MKLLQISDPHFGTEQAHVVAALRALAHAQRPDVLVLSGDITQRATTQEFAAARRFCDSLAIPRMLSIPGNHDISLFNPLDRVISPYRDYLREFGPAVGGCIDDAHCRLIGVNTTRWWRHKNGEVSRRQIEQVCAQLHSASCAQLRVVVVHQPVHVLKASDAHDLLRGAQAAVRAWSAAGADIIMGGHIHLPFARELSAAMPGLARRIWCVQAGTAVSSRIRQGISNSVNLLRYEAPAPGAVRRQCDLEQWDYRAHSQRFECSQTMPLLMHADMA